MGSIWVGVWIVVWVLLRGRSGDEGGALFIVELVNFLLRVLWVRGGLVMLLSLLEISRTKNGMCVSSSPVRTYLR